MNSHFYKVLKVLVVSLAFTQFGYSDEAVKRDLSGVLYEADAAVMEAISSRGFGFAEQFGVGGSTSADLMASKMYRSFVQVIEGDMTELKSSMKVLGPKDSQYLEFFSSRWLTAKHAQFELSAIVARPDRRRVNKEICAEIRLIYRLAYENPDPSLESSRLPMSVMLVYEVARPDSLDCSSVLGDLKMRDHASPSFRLSHLLRKESWYNQIGNQRLRWTRLETNIQVSRWPFSQDPTFAEQSSYLMRVFKPSHDGDLVEVALENTPDVNKISENRELLTDFSNWISNSDWKQSLNSGSLMIPPRFLAKKSLSVSPFGSQRFANRPFSFLFRSENIATREDLRRLDSLSCQGCHQIQSVAGFHAIGVEWHPKTKALTVRSPFSSLFMALQPWRMGDLNAVKLNKPLTSTIDLHRVRNGGLGDLCSLSTGDEHNLACRQEYKCDGNHTSLKTENLGVCSSEVETEVGAACDQSTILSASNSLKDRFVDGAIGRCGNSGICAYSKAGFPSGYCSRECSKSDHEGLCSQVPNLGPFSECVATTKRYKHCAGLHNTPALMKRCAGVADCRPDYACINATETESYCAPPYFLPELTLGHHPKDLP